MRVSPSTATEFARQEFAWRQKTLPTVAEVAPGVWVIPVPCDGFAIRFTFCYVIVGFDGASVLIDPGLASSAGRTALRRGFEIMGLSMSDVSAVIVTHYHPDHVGLAAEVAAEAVAPVLVHGADLDAATHYGEHEERARALDDWFEACGVPTEARHELRAHHVLERMPVIGRLERVKDRDELHVGDRRLTILHTPGHTAGHICVADDQDRFAFTGDHVLPTISPNIGISTAESDRDSVAEYIRSLRYLASLGDYTALPAHQYGFRGLIDRCTELEVLVNERSHEVSKIVRDNSRRSVWQVAESVSWSRGWVNLDAMNRRAALAETFAHLRHLQLSH